MRTGTRLAAAVAAASASLVVASACTGSGDPGNTSAGFTDCANKPNSCNSGSTRKGGTLTYTIEKTISNWNLNDTDGNELEFGYVARTMLPQAFIPQPDLKPVMNQDLLVSAEQTSADPQTIVYKIQPKAKWDDGTPVSADDFVYAWQTQNGRDCADCAAANAAGYAQMQSVTGSDDGKTVTVVYRTPFTDWQQKFMSMYPAHIAKQHGDLAASWKWFAENRISFSAGPFKLAEYKPDTSITLVPNEKWYGKDRSPLSKLIFRIITDQNQEIPALQNNEVQAIYPQPSKDIIDQVKKISGVNYTIGTGLQWEHLDLNLKNKFLGDKNLRQAIFTATDRDEIIRKTVGQFDPKVKPLNSHNLTPGAEGYQDVVTPTGAGTGNVEAAKKVLTDAGYKDVGTELKTPAGEPVTLRIAYTAGIAVRQQTCELFQAQMGKLGIKVDIAPTQGLGQTLSQGDFDVILFAWVADPFVFSGGVQLWKSTSDSNFGKWENKDSDTLLDQAATETDRNKAYAALNQADELLSKDFYVLPLYQKPTFLAAYAKFVNIRDNATNAGPPYNAQQWGQKAS